MASFIDALFSVGRDYAKSLGEAVLDEIGAAAVGVDKTLRDPNALRKGVRGFARGVADSWSACPHGKRSAECEKCATEDGVK